MSHLLKLGNLQAQHEADPLQHLGLALRLSLKGASSAQYAAGHGVARRRNLTVAQLARLSITVSTAPAGAN